MVDLQEGVAQEASTGPILADLSIIQGRVIAAEPKFRYDKIKESIWNCYNLEEWTKYNEYTYL